MIFQNKKMSFQAIKTRSLKSRKFDIFSKGLTHGFGPKMAIFKTFFFRQYRPGKFLLRYCRTKKCLSRLQKQEVQKVEKLSFFQRVNPWFWSKNGHFSNIFFFHAIQGRKMSFTILQNKKMPFQAIKTRSLKSRKIDYFPKELTHCFSPKMAIFPTFLLGNIGQKNVFYDILEQKNAFLGYKNKKFKKWKN